MARRFALLDKLVTWRKDITDYIRAGGPSPPDEDLRHAMIKMLPGGLSLEMFGKAHANESSEDLEDRVRPRD